MSTNELRLASLHEAGHAVATVALGGAVERVSLDRSVRADCPELDDWNAAIVSLAGAVAARTFGPNWRSQARKHSDQDLAVAASALGVERVSSHVVAQLERQAQDVLKDHRGAVAKVAEGLRMASELSGRQVERLVAGDPLAEVLAVAPIPTAADARPVASTTPAQPPSVPMAENTDEDAMPSFSFQLHREDGGFAALPWGNAPPQFGGILGTGPDATSAVANLREKAEQIAGEAVYMTEVCFL